jgi:hypothetical protein
MKAQINESDDRDFSIELASNRHLTRFSTSSNKDGGVLIEGTLGKFQHAFFVETEILEVRGSFGVLRLNLTFNEIRNHIKKNGGEEP